MVYYHREKCKENDAENKLGDKRSGLSMFAAQFKGANLLGVYSPDTPY